MLSSGNRNIILQLYLRQELNMNVYQHEITYKWILAVGGTAI